VLFIIVVPDPIWRFTGLGNEHGVGFLKESIQVKVVLILNTFRTESRREGKEKKARMAEIFR